jgi:photosystem II stability/assembly factor-like uncharacterized protein
MTTIKIMVPALLALLFGASSPNSSPRARVSQESPAYYAAVFISRGQVAGSLAPDVGVFRRNANDTSWTNIYRPNLLTFGLGMWERGSTRRYYIAAGNGLHRSDDGRRTWRILTGWQTMEVLTVALDPVDSAVIYIGTPFGIFKSTDDGRHWNEKMKGMHKWFVNKLVIDRTDRSTLYATSEDDLYRTRDGGEHWMPLHVGVPGILTFVQLPSDPRHLLAGTEDNGVRVSLDAGRTWKESRGLPNTAIYSICVSSDKQTVYAGGFRTGLWKSEDGGFSWEHLWGNSDLEAIYTIFVHPNDPNHLLVGTCGQGVYESLDGGKTWRDIGLDGCHVKQIEMYP